MDAGFLFLGGFVAWRLVLKQRYPRLYALEVKKTVDVASKLSQENLTWSFRRAPRSGVEQDQLRILTDLRGRFRKCSTQTRWIKAGVQSRLNFMSGRFAGGGGGFPLEVHYVRCMGFWM
ncbi:hypothetical protein Tco_0164665 [Tanacetum coccineum]